MGHAKLIINGLQTALWERDTRTARALLMEIFGVVSHIPYACRALYLRIIHPPQTTIQYAKGVRRKIDLYYPSNRRKQSQLNLGQEKLRDEKLPMVLFIHGGAWASGERWQYTPLALRLSQMESCVVGIASYRLYPDNLVDDMTKDVKLAMNAFHQYAVSDLSLGDTSKFTIMGHSSGK